MRYAQRSSPMPFSRLGHAVYILNRLVKGWASIAPAEPYSQLLSVLQVKFGRTKYIYNTKKFNSQKNAKNGITNKLIKSVADYFFTF